MTLHRTNVADRVSVEDYLAMRERAERGDERRKWLMSLVPVASTEASARRAVEAIVAAAIEGAIEDYAKENR